MHAYQPAAAARPPNKISHERFTLIARHLIRINHLHVACAPLRLAMSGDAACLPQTCPQAHEERNGHVGKREAGAREGGLNPPAENCPIASRLPRLGASN